MKPISRREFLRKGCDALIVGFSLHSGISPAIAWSQRISYAELIGGRRFRTTLDQKTEGGLTQPVASSGLRLKGPGELRLVGKSLPRVDVPAKVTGSFPYVHNVRVPLMLQSRVIRPPKIGSSLVSFDEGSVSRVAGLVKVVRKGNFLGVVAEREEQAIEASDC